MLSWDDYDNNAEEAAVVNNAALQTLNTSVVQFHPHNTSLVMGYGANTDPHCSPVPPP